VNFSKNDKGLLIDLSEYIDFEYRTLLGKTLVVISVRPLSEDLKYLKFEDVYYERAMTQDKKMSGIKFERHSQY